jgi:hypothetical protein
LHGWTVAPRRAHGIPCGPWQGSVVIRPTAPRCPDAGSSETAKHRGIDMSAASNNPRVVERRSGERQQVSGDRPRREPHDYRGKPHQQGWSLRMLAGGRAPTVSVTPTSRRSVCPPRRSLTAVAI